MTSTARRALDIVCAAIEASGAPIRPRGDHALMTSCPLHEDTNPSLSVTWKPRTPGGGAVLLHCFSCGAHAATIAAGFGLRMSDLFDESTPSHLTRVRPQPSRPARRLAHDPAHRWQRVRVYTYTTATGDPVLQVIRQQCRCDDTPHKRFLQRYRQGRQWNWKKPQGFTPVLYRARQLAAAHLDSWVWLTEGEKDADTAAGQGLTATTNPQGAGAFAPELAAELAGRRVAIVVDRDHAGYQRGITLHALLTGYATQTQLLLPAVTGHKADLTDHITAGRWDTGQPFGGLIQTSVTELEHLATTQSAH
jgi:hypothetical protein